MPPKTISAASVASRFKRLPEDARPPDLKPGPQIDDDTGLPVKESKIQKAIMERLQAHSWLVVRINGGGFSDGKGNFIRTYFIAGLSAVAGFPDLVAFKGEATGQVRALLIEVKKADGVLSPAQQRFHDFAARFGVKVYVLRHPDEVPEIVTSTST